MFRSKVVRLADKAFERAMLELDQSRYEKLSAQHCQLRQALEMPELPQDNPLLAESVRQAWFRSRHRKG